MNIKMIVVAAFAAVAFAGNTAETHADGIVRRVLENVAKIKAADPAAVPMAFWDFDGTIIKGDVSVGRVTEDAPMLYSGLVKRTIEEGFAPMYDRRDGWRKFWDEDYQRFKEIGRWLAWPYLAQMLHGSNERELDAFCAAEYERVYRKWYFASSVKILRALEKAGVENYIVSASPETYVRNAAATLNLPRERFRGLRVEIAAGYLTDRFVYPMLCGEGKVECVRELALGRPHGVPVAAFGNSYSTDGDYLRYVALLPTLPGGAKGTALMINGGKVVPGYTEHFLQAEQDETMGEARCE